MTGLEKIIQHIEDDADKAAKAAVMQAENEANDIIAAAEAQGKQKSEEILKQSESDVQTCIAHAQSAAALLIKKNLLDTKQRIIETVLIHAQETLLGLPAQEYFEIMLKMIAKYALTQNGQIAFSKRDKERLPDEFANSIQHALSTREGASLTLLNEARNIDGGFILIYGEMEENCSFEALFSASKESMQDKINAFLFS